MRVVALLLLVSSCAGESAPPCDGAWHVCRGQIRDADGRAVILRGMNVSGANKGAPYLGTEDERDWTRIRDDWGERVAGDPLDWHFDATSGEFTFHWTPDAQIGAPTVIAVPPRLQPVTCDACRITARGVEVDGGAGALTFTVTVP